MKKAISIILIIIFVTFLFVPSQAIAEEEPIKVYIDGDLVSFSVDPVIENGTTLVQFRPIFEELGLVVNWDPSTKKVTGEKAGLKLELIIGSTKAYVNGVEKTLSVAPKIINGNTMVPLRFIGESSDEEVVWYGETRVIKIGMQNPIDNSPDFRDASWGMSIDKVKSLEKSTLINEEENYLFYEGKLLEEDIMIIYEFVNGKLVLGGYVNGEGMYEVNSYIDFYHAVQENFDGQYGDAILNEQIWNEDLPKDDNLELAIRNGSMYYFSQWETDDTDIYASLYGESNVIYLGILFSQKGYFEIIEAGQPLTEL